MKALRTFVIATLLIVGSVFLVYAAPPLQGPLPDGKTPVSVTSLSNEPTPFFGGKDIPIRLAGGQFDPLSGSGLPTLTAGMTLDSYPGDGTGYYLVQFNGPITEADKAILTEAGAEIFDYIPDFTFIVKMNNATRTALASTGTVRWAGLYQPAYRVAPSLLYTYTATGRSETLELVVVVFTGEDVAQIANQLEALEGIVLETVETEWKGKIRVQVDATQIEAIARISGVKWVEQAPEWQLFNNVAADIMDVRDVWDNHGLRGAGQTIAVCDSGLDQGSTAPASLHNDFEDGSGNSRVITIFDRVGDGANDVNSGHGTHVAGSVLGNGTRSGATPSTHTYPGSAYVGMAPEANLVFQAVEHNATGSLAGIPFDLNTLFAQADGAGADLHSNSWGSPIDPGRYTSESQDVDEYIWNHKDFTILFAAGNEGVDSNGDGVVDLDSISIPSTAKNSITVGASENNRASGGYNPGGPCTAYGNCWPANYPAPPISTDRLSNNPNGLAAFSSRGPTNDARFKPDIVAPGTNIASTRSSVAASNGWGAINTYYMYMGGTSMATPLAAGTAVLVRDFYQDNESVTPSAALIKATLVNGATDISPGQYGTGVTQEIPDPPRPNNVEGWGRINLENSIFPAAPRTLSYDDQAFGLSTGITATYVYTVTTAGHPMRATLVWSDYPGTPAADGGLVNDLDLSIITPGGTSLSPNYASQRSVSQHLAYDDGIPSGAYAWGNATQAAVRFTPASYPATLDKGLFYVASAADLYPKTFNWYVYSGDSDGPGTLLASGSTSIRSGGWHVVDLSGTDASINRGHFFLALESPDADLVWYYDAASTEGRSWDYDGANWSNWTGNDYMFNAVVTSIPSSAAFDRANNIEGIDIASAGTGVYTLTVHGYNVPQGPQPYALVVSGAGQLSGSSVPEMSVTYLPIILASSPPPPSLPSLANGDFESGSDGSWTEYSLKGWPLIVNSSYANMVTPHAGNWAVWLGGDFDEVAELSQQVSIPAGSTSLFLTYWYWIHSDDTCGYDDGWLEVGGAKLKSYALCTSYNTGGWVKETIDVGSYAGQTVTIKFHVDTDEIMNSNFYLDDVAFQTSSSAMDDTSRSPITPSPSGPSKARPRR